MGHSKRAAITILSALVLNLGSTSISQRALAQPMRGGGRMPGMPDPRMMSGMSRVDSGLEANAISVRALLGSFAEPAVGISIKLELFAADGNSLGEHSLVSDEAGRVTFRKLDSLVKGESKIAYAIARATLGGEEEKSGKIVVDPRAGSRLLLVKGATAWQKSKGMGAPGAGVPGMPPRPGGGDPRATTGMPNPHGSAATPQNPHGGGHGAQGGAAAKAPALCKPNVLDTHPDGTLVVGLIQFSSTGELLGRKGEIVHLEVKAPGLPRQELETQTQSDGRATFEGLKGSAYPPGTRMKLWAAANPKDPPPKALKSSARVAPDVPAGQVRIKAVKPGERRLESEEFVWDGKAAVVLLTRTCDRAAKEAAKNLDVQLWRHTMTGEKEKVSGRIEESGAVILRPQSARDGDFFSVQGTYDRAPYRSNFFNLPPNSGVEVELVVYETTQDPTVLRSAAQFEFHAREDNMLQVNHYFQTFVTGNKAFWWPDLKIEGPSDTRWFQVVPGAESHLDHKDEAPYATLSQPIIPGTPVDLSVAYGVPHDGRRRIEWTSPFPLERAMAVAAKDMEFSAGALAPVTPPGGEGQPSSKAFTLSIAGAKPRLCQDDSNPCQQAEAKAATVDLEVEGIAYQRPWLRYAGIASAGLAAFGIAVGMLGRRRKDPLAELIAERDRLWRELQALESQEEPGGDTSGPEGRKDALVEALNSIYHRIEARLQSRQQSESAAQGRESARVQASAGESKPSQE